MDRPGIWKKILPGLIPIFVFIIVDEIWGTMPGLIVAVLAGSIELVRNWVIHRKFDRFVLFDTALLVTLGGISILLHNELFFKLKPGLIQLILLALLGVASFSPFDLAGFMSKRYLQDFRVNDQQSLAMRKNLKMVFWIMAAHTMLVFYATFFMSKEAWAFISGGLLYILLGIIFLVQLINLRIQRKKALQEEWVPVVTEKGEVIGKAPRSAVHRGEKILHPVIHVHFVDRHGKILLQKRPLDKLIQAGKWDTAVGGHILAGETLEEALRRETAEETGINLFEARLIKTYRWETAIEAELVYLFVARSQEKPSIQSDEVTELRYWSKNEIDKISGNNHFTPNLIHEYRMLCAEKIF